MKNYFLFFRAQKRFTTGKSWNKREKNENYFLFFRAQKRFTIGKSWNKREKNEKFNQLSQVVGVQ